LGSLKEKNMSKYPDVQQAWHSLHHNASLSHKTFDCRNDYEAEAFQNWLDTGYTPTFLEMMSEVAEEQFDVSLTFVRVGRSGATIVPQEWWTSNNWRTLVDLDDEFIEDEGEEHILAVLQWVDGYVEQGVKEIWGCWLDAKEDLGLTSEVLAKYDDAERVQWTHVAWIDKKTGKEIVDDPR